VVNVIETALPGVLEIEPAVFRDERGFFLEQFNEERFVDRRLPTHFRQDNHSRSRRHVLRGLHYQLRRPQGKLVCVIRGTIFDVAADVRRGSPTFGKWYGVTLSDEEPRCLWVPPGFAHGFCALSDEVDVVYKCTDVYVPGDEGGVSWNDAALAIDWPVKTPILSPRDRQFLPLSLERADLPVYGA
jgi:dTDP-4-dehydrorhamnose 3,5-epimerase